MAYCKDCLHWGVCEWADNNETMCSDFKNKADVVEIKHGKWLKNNTECSVCKSLNPTMYLNEWVK